MQNTRTPVKIMGISVFLNVTLSLILMGPLKIAGLALASSVSASVNMGLLYYCLTKKTGPLLGRDSLRVFNKTLAAASVMGVFIEVYQRFFLETGTRSRMVASALLALGILCGVGLYIGLVRLFKVEGSRGFIRFSWLTFRRL